jgi:hypothetical protein
MANLNSTTAGQAADQLVDELGNPTEAQVAAWKREHGEDNIKYFQVGQRRVYFKQPTRLLMKAANQALAKTRDIDAYQETILKNCQLNYKEETAKNDKLYFALAAKTDEVITDYVAVLGNE